MAPLSLPMPPPPIGGVSILNVPPPQILLAPGQAMISSLPGPLPTTNLNPFSVPPPSNLEIVRTPLITESKEKSLNIDMEIDDEDRGGNVKRYDSFDTSHFKTFESSSNDKHDRDSQQCYKSGAEVERNLQQNLENKWNTIRPHGYEVDSKFSDRRNDRDKPLQDRLRELAHTNNRGMHERDFNRDYIKRTDSGNSAFTHKRGTSHSSFIFLTHFHIECFLIILKIFLFFKESKRFDEESGPGNDMFLQYHQRFKDNPGIRLAGPQQSRFFPGFSPRGGSNFMRGMRSKFSAFHK